MDPAVVTALIAALTGLLVAVLNMIANRRNQVALETLRGKLRDRDRERDARLEYEYEARKRLYNECGPLLFQLSEAVERANGRISGFAERAADGKFTKGKTWLNGKSHHYYWASSYYRLILPISIGKLLQRRLTHLDLSLDGRIRAIYELTRALADTFTDDFDLAEVSIGSESELERALDYSPHGASDTDRATAPETRWQQGIPRGILDNAASALLHGDDDGSWRVLDYAEFEDLLLADTPSDAKSAFQRIDYLLRDFHPRTRPVLWRVLCAQFFLNRGILYLQEDNDRDLTSRQAGKRFELVASLDWRNGKELESIPRSDVEAPQVIGSNYARDQFAKLSPRKDKSAG